MDEILKDLLAEGEVIMIGNWHNASHQPGKFQGDKGGPIKYSDRVTHSIAAGQGQASQFVTVTQRIPTTSDGEQGKLPAELVFQEGRMIPVALVMSGLQWEKGQRKLSCTKIIPLNRKPSGK